MQRPVGSLPIYLFHQAMAGETGKCPRGRAGTVAKPLGGVMATPVIPICYKLPQNGQMIVNSLKAIRIFK